jgi:hypothetical protein
LSHAVLTQTQGCQPGDHQPKDISQAKVNLWKICCQLDQSSPRRSHGKLRVLPVILPGGERAKESDLPGFLQGTTWVEFHRSLDDEEALHRLACGI